MDSDISPYISCIKIGKQAIIPPLLTEELRLEMRYYRELAVSIEKRKKCKRHSTDSGVMISSIDGPSVKKQEMLPEILQSNSLINSIEVNYENLVAPVQFSNNEDNVSKENEEEEISSDFSIHLQRRNSYTLENPSPVLLEYISQKSDKKWELFIDSEKKEFCTDHNNRLPTVIASLENLSKNVEKLTLEDLVIDVIESDSKQLKNKCNLNKSCISDIKVCSSFSEKEKRNSLPSNFHASPASVTYTRESVESLKCDMEFSTIDIAQKSKEGTPTINNCWQYMKNGCNNFKDEHENSSEKNSLYQYINDSFYKDFHIIDSNRSMNLSHDFDSNQESRCSDCSSVSLSKFLFQDKKLFEGQEAECIAFSYMKEQLEKKHRIQLAMLLKEQQKEYDNLKLQFNRITSISKSSSPISSYAYSQDVVLKKYSFSESNSCTPSCVTVKKNEEHVFRESSTPRQTLKTDNFYQKKFLPEKKKIQNFDIKLQAATKINAAVRGYLTRRLFKTDRVTLLVQTIKDCLLTAVALQNESDLGLSELDLQNRILQQLTVACNELHDIFLLPIDKKMAIIASDREKRNRLLWKKNITPLPLSDATKRTLQRKNMIKSAPPGQRKYIKKSCKLISSCTSGSNSCRSTPGYKRPIARRIISQNNRRAWR